jgi:hypothetical protein
MYLDKLNYDTSPSYEDILWPTIHLLN